jgi:RNA polymerase sigma-70 factor (ECF subfamily)
MEETAWDFSSLQDRALISRSQNGDQVAFEELVRKYQHQLLSLVCWHAGPAADTDDILQVILCKVYFSLKSFDIDRPFYPWLRRIAVNRCCDERRRLRRRKMLTFAELQVEEAGIDAELPALRTLANTYYESNQRKLGDALHTVLQQLPTEHREIITLRHLKQVPYEDIAVMLQCTPRAARVKACRARTALRKFILQTSPSGSVDSESLSILRRLDVCRRKVSAPKPYTALIPGLPAQSNPRQYVMRAE